MKLVYRLLYHEAVIAHAGDFQTKLDDLFKTLSKDKCLRMTNYRFALCGLVCVALLNTFKQCLTSNECLISMTHGKLLRFKKRIKD